MKNLSWYVKRLSKMSTSEILYRIRHKISKNRDERVFLHQPLSIPSGKKLTLDPLFSLSQHAKEKQFYHLQNSVESGFLDKADLYLDNTLDIFGLTHYFGEKIDWHLEPKTGKRWPQAFWGNINIRDGFTYGGPKFVWEANRLYMLPIIGMAYQATNKKKYADKFFVLLMEWMEENTYPYGVNWTSGIELGVRVSNLIWGLSFLKGYELTGEQKEAINAFVYTHAWHLFRYPSKYSSNNNHAIAEAFGLFLISTYFHHFENATQWQKFGQSVLERECMRQILPDGGSYEYSTTYLSFVFDFFLLFKVVCNHQGIKYNRAIDTRLEKTCKFIYCLMDTKGNVPNMGDQDSAVLVNFGLDNHDNFKSILNTGAVLFHHSEFCQDNFPDIKTRLLLGKKCVLLKKNSVLPKTRLSKTRLFKNSGLFVLRESFQDKEILFVGNCMPLGMPPLCGHGHLDALSFTLSINGYEFFIDPGTYLYHSGGKFREYFRSTAAHNTLRINRRDSVEQVSDFMYASQYKINGIKVENCENYILWEAECDAYMKHAPFVMHKRSVIYRKSCGVFDITDQLKSKNNYYAECFFHLHPDCIVKQRNKDIVISRDGIQILLIYNSSVQADIVKGQNKPLLGWYSKKFNQIQETNTIVLAASFKGNSIIETKIQIVNLNSTKM